MAKTYLHYLPSARAVVYGASSTSPITGGVAIGDFEHEEDLDNLGHPDSHVLYHHVKDALYHRAPDGSPGFWPDNIIDVSNIKIINPATGVATVSFSADGGSAVAAIKAVKGLPIQKPTDPTKEDNAFKGWFLDAELTEAYNFETPITGNITLYAKWNALHTVSFNLNGGEGVIEDVTIENGLSLQKPADPTKASHVFTGWYTEALLTNLFDFDDAITANVTLYAGWEDA